MDLGSVFCPSPRGGVRRATVEVVRFKFGLTGHFIVFIWIFHTIPSFARCWLIWMGWVKAFGRPWKLRREVVTQARCGMTKFNNRDFQIRLRQRLRVRVFSTCTRCACATACGSHVNSFCLQNHVAVLTRTTRFSTNLVPRLRLHCRCKGELKG